jgi:signal transduction histidine kinase
MDTTLGAERLAQTVDGLLEGLQVLGFDWRYLYVNQAAARHGRKTREELVGRTLLECYPGVEATPLFATLEACMRERRGGELENEFTYEDGSRAVFELRIHPCHEGLVVLSLDATERKRLQQSMARAEKLRALGQMALGIAHDLRNMLNPLALGAQILRRTLRDRPEELAVLDEMVGALRHGNKTIDLLRDFSRQGPVVASEVELDAIALEAARLCRLRAIESERPIEIRKELGAPPAVRVSSSELFSALVNLVLNAIDALPAGGTIAIRTGASDGEVWVEVADDGVGMSPAAEAHAFEPFFTTKGEAGTGLGLAMVYAFAARHGGLVRIASGAGQGTRVRLSFPPAGAAASAGR